MAAAFVGLNVSVQLKEPPASLSGLVSDVKGQRLYLTNVHFLKSGKRLKEYTIHGAEIADIEVLPPESSISSSRSQLGGEVQAFEPSSTHIEHPKLVYQTFKHVGLQHTQLPPQTPQHLADPAILSFVRTRPEPDSIINVHNPPSVPRSGLLGLTDMSVDAHSAHFGSRGATHSTLKSSDAQLPDSAIPYEPSAVLTTPFNALGLEDKPQPEDDRHELLAMEKNLHVVNENPNDTTSLANSSNIKMPTKRRRRGKGKQIVDQGNTNDLDTSPEIIEKGRQSSSNGWRQTPILEQHEHLAHANQSANSSAIPRGKLGRQLGVSSTKKARRQKDWELETANGWATEDASDLHGMGDFDFEANLSKFDKLAVWDELRNDDTTADEDRLVSINRVKPQIPGTFGGKKLLPSENVLDRPRVINRDVNIGGSDDDLDDAQAISSRRMRRDLSKSSVKPHGSRNDSLNAESNTIAPLHASQRNLTNRSLSQAKYSDSHSGASPRAQAVASPASSSIFSPTAPDNRSEPCLRYSKTNHVCRTMTSETLEAVENLARNGFGMSEDVLAENAGRGIAEIALSAVNPKGHRLGQPNHNSLPVVVILVGNNKAGGRALAAARHLLERSVRVVASLTGSIDLENGPLSSQIHRFRGKFLRTWTETSTYLKSLDAPPELIIDALSGVQSTFDDLDHGHLATAMDMVAWANKSRASVLAIDVPSGIDSSSRTVEVLKDEPTEIRAKIVVCCGAPCAALFEAIVSRQNDDEWVPLIYVVDIGINPAARPFLRVNTNKENSRHRGKYIHFGSEWIAGVRYDGGNTI